MAPINNSIDSGIYFSSHRRQAITWTSDDPNHWHVNVRPRGLNELTNMPYATRFLKFNLKKTPIHFHKRKIRFKPQKRLIYACSVDTCTTGSRYNKVNYNTILHIAYSALSPTYRVDVT